MNCGASPNSNDGYLWGLAVSKGCRLCNKNQVLPEAVFVGSIELGDDTYYVRQRLSDPSCNDRIIQRISRYTTDLHEELERGNAAVRFHDGSEKT
jgi:hypothetical protein